MVLFYLIFKCFCSLPASQPRASLIKVNEAVYSEEKINIRESVDCFLIMLWTFSVMDSCLFNSRKSH